MCPKYARTFPELFPNTPKTARNPSEVHPKSTRNLPDQRHSPKSTRNISEMYPKHIRIVTELCPAYSRTMPGSLTASHSLRPSDMGPPCLEEQRAQRAIEYCTCTRTRYGTCALVHVLYTPSFIINGTRYRYGSSMDTFRETRVGAGICCCRLAALQDRAALHGTGGTGIPRPTRLVISGTGTSTVFSRQRNYCRSITDLFRHVGGSRVGGVGARCVRIRVLVST